MTEKQEHDLSYISEQLRHLAIPIEQLNLDPANARLHPERNLSAVRSSLAKFGLRQPIVVQKQGMIVRAGNARLTCAKDLGWTHIAAVVVDEQDVDAVAYAIADNRTAELAEWDDDTLVRLMQSLPREQRDATGFSDKELRELMPHTERDAEPDVDNAAELNKKWQVKYGDMFGIGKITRCPKCGKIHPLDEVK